MLEVQRQPPRPSAARKAAAPEPALQDVKTGTTDAYFAYPAVVSTGTDDPSWYDRTKSRPFASRSLNDLAVSIQQTPPRVGDVECRIPSLAVLRSPPADRSGCSVRYRRPGSRLLWDFAMVAAPQRVEFLAGLGVGAAVGVGTEEVAQALGQCRG